MSRISAHRSSHRTAGFTLIELMISASLALIVIGGILSAFLFLGRNLTRMVNLQQQEVKSRTALQLFTTDVSSAIQFTTATDTQIVLTVQTAGSPATVTYTYTAGAASTGTLVRAYTPSGGTTATTTLLTGLSAFDFNFYTESGVSTTSLASVKSAEFSFTSASGNAASGTQVSYDTVSSRVLLRNKPALL